MSLSEDQLKEMRQVVLNCTGEDFGDESSPDWMYRINLRVAYTRLYNRMWMEVNK